MLKLAGAALVLVASTGFGLASCGRRRELLRFTESWASALEQMALEIGENRSPMPRLLENLSREGPVPLRGFFSRLLAEAESLRWEELAGSWHRQLADSFPQFPREELGLLEPLGGELGRFAPEEQARTLRRVAVRMDNLGQERRRELASSKKTTLALSASAGVMAVIMLL